MNALKAIWAWLRQLDTKHAAIVGAFLVFVVTLGNSLLNVYPNESWTPVLAALLTALTTYLPDA